MRRQTSLKLITICFLAQFTLGILGSFVSEAHGSILPLSTASTLFFKWFPDVRDYVLTYLNVTTFGIDHPFAITSDEATSYQSERSTVAAFALLDTLAYEQTSDARYLAEAKWVVDGLRRVGINSNQSVNVYYKSSPYAYWLYADVNLLLAEQKLNEHGFGSYNVINMTDFIISQANVNTAQYLGWYYLWNQKWQPQSDDGQTIDDWSEMFLLLGYLTNRGVKDYSSALTRLKAYTYIGQTATKNFKYAINSTSDDTGYCVPDVQYMLMGKYFHSSLLSNAEVNELVGSNSTGLPVHAGLDDSTALTLAAVYDIAKTLSFSPQARVKAAMAVIKTFLEVNNLGYFTTIWELRTQLTNICGLLITLGMTKTPATAYSNLPEGLVWQDKSDASWKRITTEDVDYNTSYIGYAQDVLREKYNFYDIGLNIFGDVGLDSGFASVTYDAANKLYTAVTPIVYDCIATYKHYLGGLKTNLTLNGFGSVDNPDRRINQYFNYASDNHYIVYAQNQTEYNMDSWTTSMKKLSQYFAVWDYQYGLVNVFKISDTNYKIYYCKSTSSTLFMNSSLSVEKWRFTIIAGNSANQKTLVKEILADIVASGTFSHSFTLSLGSAKWQLQQLTDITVYTDKNMTSANYDGSKLTFTINANTGQTSTTQVYVGSHTNDPKSVTGATSWSYDPASRMLTISILHSGPARIRIFWKVSRTH